MSLAVALQPTRKKVAVLDDRPRGRTTLAGELRRANFEPEIFAGTYSNIPNLVTQVLHSESQAAVCDYKLNLFNYVRGNGAEAVREFYNNKLPSILITNIDEQIIEEIRPYRRYIPVLLDKADIYPDTLKEGIQVSEEELRGHFQPNRRPWRAMIRINWIDNGIVGIVLPGWDSDQEVHVIKDIFPTTLWQHLVPDRRFFAQVNIGAEDESELYFTEFEEKIK